jgi:UPF0716 protein FxsA
MSVRPALVLILIAFPLLEIALLIKAGQTIGFWPLLALLLAATVLGMIVIREQGLSMVSRVLAVIGEGRFPIESLINGYVLVIAGLLLILPGFLSDALALLLLVPPVRRAGIRRTLAALTPQPRGSPAARGPRVSRPPVIEGTYERLDVQDEKTRRTL